VSEFNNRVRAQRAAERRAQADAEAKGLPIFDAPKDNGTATSKAAARRVAPHVGTMLHAVWTALLDHPEGLTRAELVEVTGLGENTINPRSRTLLDSGFAYQQGERDGRAVLFADMTKARAA